MALSLWAGCGGGSTGGGSSSGGYACPAADPTKKSAACISCLKTSCDAPMRNAYGPNWASGVIGGGSCPSSLVACATGCTCNDTTCNAKCLSAAGAGCTGAVISALDCGGTSCQMLCM